MRCSSVTDERRTFPPAGLGLAAHRSGPVRVVDVRRIPCSRAPPADAALQVTVVGLVEGNSRHAEWVPRRVINLAIQKSGARLVSVTENIDETPSGMLLHGIMSSIAELYSRNLGAEVLKGSTQKAQSGGTPGRAPVGYRNVIRLEHGSGLQTVELDSDRAPMMRWAFVATLPVTGQLSACYAS